MTLVLNVNGTLHLYHFSGVCRPINRKKLFFGAGVGVQVSSATRAERRFADVAQAGAVVGD